MSHNQMLGRDEIINNLLMLDEEISLLFDNDDHYDIVIVGGSALVLIEKITRATMDIDTIACSNELRPFMERYNINNRVAAYRNFFPDDYLDRRVKLDIPTKKISIYTASLEDIIIAKLSAQRPQDIQDLKNPKVIESINWSVLDSIVNDDEFRLNMLNEHAYNMFMISYREYKEEVQHEEVNITRFFK